MDILAVLDGQVKAAMKSGQKDRLDALRVLKAGLQKLKIDKGGITEQDVTSYFLSESKRRKEAIDLYRQGGRDDLRVKEERELELIAEFLPKQLSPEEVVAMVDAIIKEIGASSAKDTGKVMSVVMAKARGQVDGKQVQEIVKSKLT